MRSRVVVAISAVALLVVALSPADAGAKKGKIVVKKSISLLFPSPGNYTGRVSIGKASVKRNAKNGAGKKADKGRQREARGAAARFCRQDIKKRKVKVAHLSRPVFTIGTTKPDRKGRYSVFGNEPPTGERVRASHPVSFKNRLRTGPLKLKKRIFSWVVECEYAKKVRPYPH